MADSQETPNPISDSNSGGAAAVPNDELTLKIKAVGDEIRELKNAKADSDAVMAKVEELKALKAEFEKVTGAPFDPPKAKPANDKKPANANKKAEGKSKGGGGGGKSASEPKKGGASAAAEPPKGGFVRLEHIRANEINIQDKWEKEKTFQSTPAFNEDGSPKPKFMVTFPYPYMNGRLHLGHAFSLTKAEFSANYKRLTGHQVLFPFGFHCTGMPIQAAANKLKAEIAKYGNPPVMPEAAAEKKEETKGKSAKGKVAAKAVSSSQWQTLLKMNIPAEEIPAFQDPMTWLQYFPNWGITDLKLFGVSVDWRRSFITTSVNPYYNAFIEWQYRQLKTNDKIVFGKRAGIYSPRDGQVCADHDRSEGEGVAPQEYTLIKLRVKEPYPPALQALAGTPVFLAPATLRPETMYGQTNCFVLPEGDYGAYRWANGDVLIMSERSAIGLAHQSYKNENYATEWGKVDCVLTMKGTDLIGMPISAPRAAYETLYVLPLLTISMGKGTGVVTSVPSDAPDDWVALEEFKNKPEFRKKFGLTDEMVLPFEVVPIINITVPDSGEEEGWSSDVAAAYWSEKLGIKSTKDRVKLDEAKKKTYNSGFTFGKMLVGPYQGEKVSIAKPKEKQDMIDAGEALVYFEPEKYVESRTGEACVVAMTDQWYLKYGEDSWREQVSEHVNDPTKFTPYSQDILDKFNFTLGWLQEWACSRLFGLGTQLPWDQKWVIESLSDSTIYMAFYTIAHMLQGEANLDGTKPSPCGIKPEQLNDDIFNYIYLRGPLPTTDIPTETLDALRKEFEYWYPMDLRVSGKDLIGNHLTMCLYSHASIWKDRPEMWPRSYYTNGHLNLNNDKMSKSTGNFLMLEEAINNFSADATRYALSVSGDTLENANFETDSANAATNMLYIEEKFVREMVAEIQAGKLRKGDMLGLEVSVLNEMNGLIAETTKHFEGMMWRDGVNAGSAQFKLLRDFYREWCGQMGLVMHEELVNRYLSASVLLIAPVCPHFAENLWSVLGHQGSVFDASWPIAEGEFDAMASKKLRFLQKSVKNLRAGCLKEKHKATPTKATILIADKYSDWKVTTLKFMQEIWQNNNGSLPEKKDLMQALTEGLLKKDAEMMKLKKDVMQFAAYVAEESLSLGRDALDTDIPFDQMEVLSESKEYLSKHLINNAVLELTIQNMSDPDAPSVKKAPEPGKPSIYF